VFVDAACLAVLLDSLTEHFGWRPGCVAEAQAAYATMIQRAAPWTPAPSANAPARTDCE